MEKNPLSNILGNNIPGRCKTPEAREYNHSGKSGSHSGWLKQGG
jgi:hypothetical protein